MEDSRHIRQIIIEEVKAYAKKFENRGISKAEGKTTLADFDSIVENCADDILGDIQRHDRNVQAQLQAREAKAREHQYHIDLEEIDKLSKDIERLKTELKKAREVNHKDSTIKLLEAKLSDRIRVNKALVRTVDALMLVVKGMD